MARFARQTAYEKLRRAGCHVPRWRGVERARDGADCAVCGDRAGSAGRSTRATSARPALRAPSSLPRKCLKRRPQTHQLRVGSTWLFDVRLVQEWSTKWRGSRGKPLTKSYVVLACHVPRWRGVERAQDGAECAVCGDRAGGAGRQSPFLRTSFIINRCDVEGGKRRAAGLFVVHRWLLLLV